MGSSGALTRQRAVVMPGPTGSTAQDSANLIAAVQAAINAGGGVVQLQYAPGTQAAGGSVAPNPYKYTGGILSVPDGVTIQGEGGGFGFAASCIQLQAAGDGINVAGGGGVCGGFRIDANNVATAPFTRSGGTHGSARTFIDLGVLSSAQDSGRFIGAQNDVWIQCNFNGAARDNGYFDQGYGGAAFYRCEWNAAGRYHHNYDALIGGGVYTKPTDILHSSGICEGSAGTSVLKVTSGFNIRYSDQAFYTSNSLAGDLIDIVGGQDISFHNPWIINGNGGVAVAGSSGIRVRGTSNAIISGAAKLQNLVNGYLIDNTASFVQPLANTSLYSVTNIVGTVNGGTAAQAGTYSPTAINYNPTNATDLFQSVYTALRNALRFSISAAGVIRWYPGTNFAADVAIARQAVGVAGITPATAQGWSVGAGGTGSRPAAPVAGTCYFDQTLNAGAGMLVTYNGANWVNPSTGVTV